MVKVRIGLYCHSHGVIVLYCAEAVDGAQIMFLSSLQSLMKRNDKAVMRINYLKLYYIVPWMICHNTHRSPRSRIEHHGRCIHRRKCTA